MSGIYYGMEAAPFLRVPWLIHVQRFLYQFMLCNLGMCIFNLLPFPPLDGFHVFNDILLRGKLHLSAQAFRLSMLALLVVMNVTNFFSRFISTVEYAIQGSMIRFFLTLFRIS